MFQVQKYFLFTFSVHLNLRTAFSLCVFFQLRLTVAEALGSMCHLMASEKLEEQIPRLIPSILSLYKKNNEHYIISKVSWRWLGSGETLCPSCLFLSLSTEWDYFLFSPESLPGDWCICQHGQQSAGDATGQSACCTASTGTQVINGHSFVPICGLNLFFEKFYMGKQMQLDIKKKKNIGTSFGLKQLLGL